MAGKKTVEPARKQVVMRFEVQEDLLPPTHPARVLWEVTGTLRLGRLLERSRSFEGEAGRPTLSPRMKLCLWLYAMSQGIGSAREIARLSSTDDAFKWIVGDCSVHHDTLSEFRAQQGEAFDGLLSDILAALMHKEVLSLEVVAQDGMRVRASASAPSFRSYGSLLQCREQAALHVKAVLAQADDPELTRAQRERRIAAAKDFQRRVEEAIGVVGELRKDPRRKNQPRASTTDSEARVMKMADGGFRPAYNVQLATAGSDLGGPRTIVGVRVTNVGSDMGAIPPMLDDIQRRTGELPKTLLADANHTAHDAIRDATRRGVTVIAPVPETSIEPGSQAAQDGPIKAWRERMETEEAKRLYRRRASLCELSNAHTRCHRGLDQFLVRGLTKVTSVVLLSALASNLLQHATTLLA